MPDDKNKDVPVRYNAPDVPVREETPMFNFDGMFAAIRSRIPFLKPGVDSSKVSQAQLNRAVMLMRQFSFDSSALRYAEASWAFETYGVYDQDSFTYGMDRHTRYREYGAIQEKFPEASNAIDIYADECTQKNEDGNVFKIHSKNPEVKAVLEKLFFEKLNMNAEAWSIVRSMVATGDQFAEIVMDGNGIKRLKYRPAYSVYVMYDFVSERILGYAYDSEAQFRMNRGLGQSGVMPATPAANSLVYYSPSRMVQWSLRDMRSYPYGMSILERVRNIALMMWQLEESMTLYRISRAPERRVFFVDMRGIPTNRQSAYIKDIRDTLKTKKDLFNNRGLISRYKPMGFDEDYFIPVRSDGTTTRIETLPGAQNLSDIGDINYFQSKFVAGMGMPKAYMGREEMLSSRSTLVQQDIRFAKRAARIQSDFVRGCYLLAWVELAMKNSFNLDEVEFWLEPTLASYVDEISRLEINKERVDLASSMVSAEFADPFYAQTRILRMDPRDIEEINRRKETNGEEGGGGGAVGGGGFGGGTFGGELAGAGEEAPFGVEEGGEEVAPIEGETPAEGEAPVEAPEGTPAAGPVLQLASYDRIGKKLRAMRTTLQEEGVLPLNMSDLKPKEKQVLAEGEQKELTEEAPVDGRKVTLEEAEQLHGGRMVYGTPYAPDDSE